MSPSVLLLTSISNFKGKENKKFRKFDCIGDSAADSSIQKAYFDFQQAIMPSSSTPTLTTIPTISLRTPHPHLLTQLRHALLTTGFLYLTGSASAIPELPALIAQLVGSLPRLFALPDDEKEKISLDYSPHFLGYSGVGSEVTARRRDEREQFEFASELKAVWKEGEASYLKLLGPNQVRIC
jgi:isopenicillin N synthase-like dioxygenase